MTDHDDVLSVASRDGRVSEQLYVFRHAGDKVELVRLGPDGKSKTVARAGRFGREVEEDVVRVSPDERYLAYAIRVRFKVPIPTGGVVEIYVRDMKRRRTYRIEGIYVTVSNLIWSPDSKRLYYGAANFDAHGVYRVTVPD